MFFEFDAETPANTTEASPVETEMKLAAGIIHYVGVMFPDGCAGLAHARIKQVNFHLYPKDDLESLKGDGTHLRFFEHYELKPGLTKLTLQTWNTDTTNAHKITARIGLLQQKELFPEIRLADMMRMFFRLFRRRV